MSSKSELKNKKKATRLCKALSLLAQLLSSAFVYNSFSRLAPAG
jgi:hypothetical protein